MASLIVKTGKESGREILLKPGLNRVGRHPENDIQISEPSISSFHCELNVAEIGVALRDLDSTNGSFINQQRVSRAILQRGDTLTLGDIDLVPVLDEVEIRVPEIQFEQAPGAAFLADGTPACFKHREVPAAYRCTKCEEWFCPDCVRILKRLNGELLKFCPECDAPCVPLETTAANTRKKNIFERIGETLRIPRKK